MPLLTELGDDWGLDFYKDVAPERGLACRRLVAMPHAAAAGVIFSRQNSCWAQSRNCEMEATSRIMNIQDFVSESLRQIGDGVAAASTNKGIEISPQPLGGQAANVAVGSLVARGTGDGRRLIEFVEFDLSVTVQAKIEGSAGAELALPVIGGGKGEVSSGLDQTRVQRVKFRVPIIFKNPNNDTAAQLLIVKNNSLP